jgi:putative transposase
MTSPDDEAYASHDTPLPPAVPAITVPLHTLSATARQEALARFQIIQPFLERGVPLPEVIHHHGVALRTARRWVQRYRRGGLTALSKRPRADRGTPHRVSPAVVQTIEALALQTPPLSVAAIHRQIVALTTTQGIRVPSYRTVYNTIKQIAPALRTLAHEGSHVYRETFDLLYRREADAPNAIWQADHTLLDLLLTDEQGQARKPWLTVLLDDYSRAVAGYMVAFEAPSALHTALALRQAIWRKSAPAWSVCGIPQLLYTDHGSDFTSQHLEHVCADLKIQAVFSHVGIPRGRGRIERFCNTVNQLLLSRLPGYAPAGYATQVTPVLDLQGFTRAFEHFVLTEYHQTPHSATGVPPHVRWSANGFLPQLPVSLEHLDLLLLTVAKSRRVQQDGVRFQSLRYIDPTLAVYVGEDVTIRYDPRDMAEIRVYHHTRFVCRAVCQELAGETVSLQDIVRARRQRTRALQEQLAARQSLVDQLLVSASPPVLLPASPLTSPERPPQTPPLKRYVND